MIKFNFEFNWPWVKKSTQQPTQDNELIKQQAVQQFIASQDNTTTPLRPGRSSVVTQQNVGLSAQTPTGEFPYHILPVIENAAIYNRHVSYAVYNIITLANTPYEIYFSDKISDRKRREMLDHLRTSTANWYEFSDGLNSLINDLLFQVATFGALSAELDIEKRLTGVKKVVRVNPVQVRFAYDAKSDMYIPLQEDIMVRHTSYPGYRELNRRTYSYKAMNRYGNEPVAIPPVISALEDLVTEGDMLGNFKSMIKKLGMLGFLSVLVAMPERDDGEEGSEYQNRLVEHLDRIYPQIEGGFSKGISVGYKDHHEFKLEGSNMNANGADKLFDMIKRLVYAGIKQDPNMMGENYSTTETFGRVILAKMTQQITNYQTTVASFLEKAFLTELTLNGYNPGYVQVEFQRAMVGDRKREAETEKLTIENIIAKYNAGWISQEQAAQEAGYDEPDQEEPRKGQQVPMTPASGEGAGAENPTPDGGAQAASRITRRQVEMAALRLRSLAPEYNYTVPDSYGADRLDLALTDFKDATIQKKLKTYWGQFNSKFGDYLDDVCDSVKKSLFQLRGQSGDEMLQQIVLFHLYSQAENFRKEMEGVAEDNVFDIYDHYRRDKSIFKGAGSNSKAQFADGDIPDAVFGLLDYRAIEYLHSQDAVYLGKFITDTDTRERITRWMNVNYLAENSPVGKSGQVIDDFINDFRDTVDLERWKARRIIETSVNKIRNYANVNYIDQANVTNYEIVEVLDDRTCRHCRHMNGMTFEVKKTVSKIKAVIDGGHEAAQQLSPFATTIQVDDFEQLTASDLQARGVDAPSYHPHCRGRVIARI